MTTGQRKVTDVDDQPKAWAGVIPAADEARYDGAGFRWRGGFGHSPAVLVIDVQDQTTGPRPMPIDEAIELYPRACGEAG